MFLVIKKGADKSKIAGSVKMLFELNPTKGIDAYKYCGVIELKETPSEIQKRLRSEWD